MLCSLAIKVAAMDDWWIYTTGAKDGGSSGVGEPG